MNNLLSRRGAGRVSGAVCVVVALGLNCFAFGVRLQGASPVLWNVDFGADPVSLKSGPAAYGLEATDYWNAYYFPWTTLSYVENLRRSDGTESAVGVTVAGADGGWGTGSADPMFLSYIYPNPGNSPAGGPILVTLTNLPPGYYDFYVYAHGADPGEYSVCQLSVAGIEYGTQSTANAPVYTLTEWIEGQQFVRYSDVRVPAGQAVYLSVGPSPEDNAALNGLQVVLRQPMGGATPEGCAPIPAGLVGWWKGDGNAADWTGANDGTLAGTVTFGPGRVGQGFVFSGTGDGVLLGDPEALQLQDFTIEAWIRRSSASQASVDFGGGVILGGGYAGYALGMFDDGTPYLTRVGIDAVSPVAAIADTDLHHLAVTKVGSTVVFYIDGQAYPVEPYITEYTFGSGFALGSLPDAQSNTFLGLIDEAAVYSRALSGAEVQAIFAAGAAGKCSGPVYRGPSARWAFDETGGATAHDAIGTKHGTLSTTGAQFTEGGIRGNALRLDRSLGGLVDMGDVLDLKDTFTLVAWVKTEPNDTTESSVVLARHAAGTANGYYLSLNRSGFLGQPGKALFTASDPAGQELVSTTSLNDGQWHQVVAVYDRGVGKRLYVNGQPVEASGAAVAIVPNTAPFLVGGVSVGGMPQGFFTGWIDELQVYERVLADAEIEYLYANPEATQIPETLEPLIQTGLVNQTVSLGATVELKVTVTGQEPLAYAWSKDGTVREDATGSSLILSDVQPADGGLYSVVVSNRWGTATSSATVQVLWPPIITVPPVGQWVALGGSVTLSVTAEGAPPLSYAWLRNGRLIPNATSRFLLLNNVAETADYQARVRNNDGTALSFPVTVRVYSGRIQAAVVAEAVQFNVTGLQPGRNYVLEQAGALSGGGTAWEAMVTILNATESFQFTDPEPPAAGHRYYRLRVIP